MDDHDKSKDHLITDLVILRQRVAELEETGGVHARAPKSLPWDGEGSFRRIFENHSAILYAVDLESYYIVDANSTALRFYGYDRETMLTKRIPDLNVTPEDEIRREVRNGWSNRP